MSEDQRKQVQDLDTLFQSYNGLKAQVGMLSEEKRYFQEALRARDATITRLRATIENATETKKQTMRHLGILDGEEEKDEPEGELLRVANKVSTLA